MCLSLDLHIQLLSKLMQWLCTHLHFTVLPLSESLKFVHSVFALCLKCSHTSLAHLYICMSDNWLQESAVKDSLFVFGGNSLSVQAFAPSSLVLTPSTPFVHSIFHACSFTPLSLHHPHPTYQPSCCPSPNSLLTYPLVPTQLILDQCESRAFCCEG